MSIVRRHSILLLLALACAAPGACIAQAQPRETLADEARAEAGKSRSAFGRVMDVMISALQHQSRAQAQSAGGARTTAAGTPTGIEVGAAFSDALEAGKGPAAGAPAPGTGTGGAAAAEAPRAAPPELPSVHGTTLAGPG